jgi:L-2-hydroxyglutarate oxidase LhgO
VDSFGRIDVLFNNAGFNKPLPFLEVDEANFNSIMHVNAWGVMLGIQEGAKQMIAQGGGGKIINTASIAGRQGYAEFVPYCCSKSAVISLTQAGAREFAKHKITVNAFAPGVVVTPLWDGLEQDMIDKSVHQEEGRVHRELLGQHPARLLEARPPRGDRSLPGVARLQLYHRTGHHGTAAWCWSDRRRRRVVERRRPVVLKAALDAIDCLVIGAGVVGLAAARALARAGRDVIVVEAESAIGTGVSSRSSEVLHAGIYYPTGLTKTRLCVEGKAMLYEFCREYGVPHKRCGKLIVTADEAETAKLAALEAQAKANGVADLVWLTGQEARALEPALKAERALLSPSSGIVDSHALMAALRGDAEAHGAMVALETPVVSGWTTRRGVAIETGGAEPMRLEAKLIVNAAGLGAQAVARTIEGMPADKIPPLHLAKGNYFSLSGRSPFGRLVYPMPAPGGLGVHLTLDLGGQARFGPDVEWIETIGYDVDPRRAQSFYAAIRTYWPDLPDGALQPAYAGVRPKIARPGGSSTDFLIQTERDHGVRGLINLFGIESPGLTASLAIAEEIAKRL